MRKFYRVRQKPSCHPLVRVLVDAMNEQQIGVQDACERAGIHRNTWARWGTEHTPDIRSLEALAGVLGLRLVFADEQGTLFGPSQDKAP